MKNRNCTQNCAPWACRCVTSDDTVMFTASLLNLAARLESFGKTSAVMTEMVESSSEEEYAIVRR